MKTSRRALFLSVLAAPFARMLFKKKETIKMGRHLGTAVATAAGGQDEEVPELRVFVRHQAFTCPNTGQPFMDTVAVEEDSRDGARLMRSFPSEIPGETVSERARFDAAVMGVRTLPPKRASCSACGQRLLPAAAGRGMFDMYLEPGRVLHTQAEVRRTYLAMRHPNAAFFSKLVLPA